MRFSMARPRKLSPKQVEQIAIDRRSGMSWQKLRVKYKCAVNTLRSALSDYSDEFNPIRSVQRSELEKTLEQTQSDLTKAQSDIDTIKTALCEELGMRF